VVFVLAFSPAGLERSRQLCSDQREEQVKALGLSSRTANGGASVSLGSSHVCTHALAYSPIPTHSPDRDNAVFSRRLGHARVLTVHRTVIHFTCAASLPRIPEGGKAIAIAPFLEPFGLEPAIFAVELFRFL